MNKVLVEDTGKRDGKRLGKESPPMRRPGAMMGTEHT